MMRKALMVLALTSGIIGYGPFARQARAAARQPVPETVVVYYRAREGKQADLLKILRRQWAMLTSLNLVKRGGHLLYRGKDESGGAVFIEIFTWRNAVTPDDPPAKVLSLWGEMRALVEVRGGHPGIEITAVKPVHDSKVRSSDSRHRHILMAGTRIK